jgi:hypothetical protein
MDEPAIETHPDDVRCPICGLSVLTFGSQHFAEIYDPNDGAVEESFCSWNHLAEWTAKGSPEFPVVTIDRWETSIWERTLDGLVLLGITAWTVLGCYGLITVVDGFW